MKMTSVFAALVAAAVVSPAMAFTPPSDEQITAVLADHTQLNALIADASPAEAASVVSRAFAGLEESVVPPASRDQAAALLYTRALLLSGENAPAMVQSLAGQINQEVVPVIASATAIAVGSTEGPVFSAMTAAVGADSPAAANIGPAAANPVGVLGEDNVALVQQLVIELRGVAAPVIPPPQTAPRNIVPPLVPVGEGAATPPPPPAPLYVNQ